MESVLEQVCTNCGSLRMPDGHFCLFCGDVLEAPTAPTRLLTLAEDVRGGSPVLPLEAAGFWRRVWAGLIDVALEALGALVLTILIDFVLDRFGRWFGFSPSDSKFATGMSYILVLSVGSWLYAAFSESSSWQATLGKRFLGLQVITARGDKVSFGQATVRHFMKFLSLFSAGVGFLMALWTRRHQALHDMPSDCLVVRRPPESGFSLLHR